MKVEYKQSNLLGRGTVNKCWNITVFHYMDIAIQQCNKYGDFFFYLKGLPTVAKTEQDCINSIATSL